MGQMRKYWFWNENDAHLDQKLCADEPMNWSKLVEHCKNLVQYSCQAMGNENRRVPRE